MVAKSHEIFERNFVVELLAKYGIPQQDKYAANVYFWINYVSVQLIHRIQFLYQMYSALVQLQCTLIQVSCQTAKK